MKNKKEPKKDDGKQKECVTICKTIYDKKEEAEANEYEAKKRDNYNSVVIFTLIALVFFTIGVVVYSVYVFIRVTHLSDLAGVHVTQSLQNAADYMEGKAPAGNTHNPTTYKGDIFEFQYPDSLEFKKDSGIVTLKEYNKSDPNNFNSLAMLVTTGEIDNPKNLPINNLLDSNNRSVPVSAKEIVVGGRSTLRTGKIRLSNGPITDTIYWKLNGKVVYCSATYYDQNTTNLEIDFQNIISSFKF